MTIIMITITIMPTTITVTMMSTITTRPMV
jgi:hypothetical protein